MTYAVMITVAQLGELVFISCCCMSDLFFHTARCAVDVYMKQLLGDSGGRAGEVDHPYHPYHARCP